MQSDQINEYAKALAAAQSEMESAKLDKVNPHFRSKYSSLAAVIEAIRKPLTKNGMAWTQTTEIREGGMVLVTTLAHTSGQWMKSEYPLPATGRPQEIGSALTYARRYTLSGITGLSADEDDDAEGAERGKQKIDSTKVAPKPVAPPVSTDGEVSPHKIEWNDNALAWGALYIAAIKSSEVASDIAEWQSLNKDALAIVQRTAPKAYKSIQAAHEMCLGKFTQQAAE